MVVSVHRLLSLLGTLVVLRGRDHRHGALVVRCEDLRVRARGWAEARGQHLDERPLVDVQRGLISAAHLADSLPLER